MTPDSPPTLCCGHLSLQALQCFQEAATEVEKEEFLMRLTGVEEEEAASTPRLQYYSKVHDVTERRLMSLTGILFTERRLIHRVCVVFSRSDKYLNFR